ncbi:hypothetical protein CEQ90_16400 [Lewinellaceae bacterium SD302]|nr:hypothetical protein CEQ90_16400 [Lewinellaceae bacterium SD302]
MANKNRGVGRTPQGQRNRGRTTGTGAPVQEGDDLLVDVVEVRDQAASFFEENRNLILGIAIGLAAIIAGILIYNTLVVKPRNGQAIEQMQRAQVQFERDSFQLALANPGGGYPGFLEVIDQYGSTPAGNLARYYAGISYLNLGSYDAAADYLGQFDAETDLMATMKAGALGDIQSEKSDFDAAISSYRKAVDQAGDNYLLAGYYLNKLGLLLRNQGRNEEALDAFKRLKQDFGQSPAAAEADKYIGLLGQ